MIERISTRRIKELAKTMRRTPITLLNTTESQATLVAAGAAATGRQLFTEHADTKSLIGGIVFESAAVGLAWLMGRQAEKRQVQSNQKQNEIDALQRELNKRNLEREELRRDILTLRPNYDQEKEREITAGNITGILHTWGVDAEIKPEHLPLKETRPSDKE